MTETVLNVRGVSVRYGGVYALQDVSVSVLRGELLGLIGPNGAGKTTLFNVLTGLAPLAGGQVIFDGNDVTHWSTPRRFRAGISRSFQIPEIVTEMTVLENAMLGCRRNRSTSLLHQLLRLPAYRHHERDVRERSRAMLDLVGLGRRMDDLGGSLPLGDVRLLELARVLLSEPKVLLLDELASGLTDDELGPIEEGIEFARTALSASVVLVEHNISWVMRVVDRLQVLAEGQSLAAGTPAQIRVDQRVIDAYLGTRSGGTT